MADITEIATEDLRALFDVAVGSMNFTSGFLDTEEVEVLQRAAVAIGVDPMVATPKEFATQYPHDFAPYRIDERVCAWEGCRQPARNHPDRLRKR